MDHSPPPSVVCVEIMVCLKNSSDVGAATSDLSTDIAVISIQKPKRITYAIGVWRKMEGRPWKKHAATRTSAAAAVAVTKWASSFKGATSHRISTAPSRSRDRRRDLCRRRAYQAAPMNHWDERDRKIYQMLPDPNKFLEVGSVAISCWKRSLARVIGLIHWPYMYVLLWLCHASWCYGPNSQKTNHISFR